MNNVASIAIRTEKFVRVPVEHARQDSDLGRTVNQLIRIFIKPELERRGVAKFGAAIIEMFHKEGEKPKIYLDGEAPFALELKEEKMKQEYVGKSFRELGWTFDDVKDIRIAAEGMNPDSAKVFLIRWGEEFFLYFDFRYNQERVKRKLVRAREFLDAVGVMDFDKQYFVICYLLWAAMELIGDSVMLSMPYKEPSRAHPKKKAQLVKMKQNLNVISDEFMDMFDQFSLVQPEARYADQTMQEDALRAKALIQQQYIKKAVEKLKQELVGNVILGM